MAEYPDAIEYYVDQSRVFGGVNTHEVLVLHGTGGNENQTVQELGDWFRSDPDEASSTFGIDRAGNVAQYVRLADGAAANCCVESGFDPFWQPYQDKYGNLPGKLNRCTISIEHVNNIDNSLPLTDAQKAASFKLAKWLCDTLNIPYDHIKTHASIAPIDRAHCPGNYPEDELHTFLGGSSMSGVPSGWKDDGTILTAQNGVPMRQGFRNAVLTAPTWDPDNVPQEAEYAANPAQLHRPDLGTGTRQTMRDGVFWWTPGSGVIYEQFVGLELDATYKMLTSAQQENATLQTKVTNQQQSITALQQQVQTLQSGKPLEDLQTRMKQINSLSTI